MKFVRTFPLTLVGIAFMAGIALAQAPSAPQPQQSASERALAQRLMGEINNGLQCGTALIAAQDEIAKLQKEVADLKAAVAAATTAAPPSTTKK